MARKRTYTVLTLMVLAAAISLGVFFGVFAGGTDGGSSDAGGSSAALSDGAGATDALVSETGAAPGGGSTEGIKVHGHWTIEVRDPDGSLVSRTEFDNALSGGTSRLPKVLARVYTIGLWGVKLGDINGP